MPRVPTSVFLSIAFLFVCALLIAAFGFPEVQAVADAGLEVLRRSYFAAGVAFFFFAFRRPFITIANEHTPVGETWSLELGRGARRLIIGLFLMLAFGLAGCASASGVHAAYCAGVSAGGRAALAELATGRPEPVIACDPVTPTPGAAPAPIVVIIRPGDLAHSPLPAPVPVLAEPADPLI